MLSKLQTLDRFKLLNNLPIVVWTEQLDRAEILHSAPHMDNFDGNINKGGDF